MSCNSHEKPFNNAKDVIILQNGLLIDGNGSKPEQNGFIVIESGRIKYIGHDLDLSIAENARLVDLSGKTIMPGFINAHVHYGYDASNLKEWAKSGVTTVRDLSNLHLSTSESFSIRDELLKDNVNARLVAAGPMISAIGGYGNYFVSSQEDARQKTLHIIKLGADVIKIAIEDNLQGRRWNMLSIEEIRMIVQTAHENNLPVSAHISQSKHLEIAIASGVDDVAHMIIDELSDDHIISMINKNIYWVPTLELWSGVSEIHTLNLDMVAISNLRKFVSSGGKVALGTDYNGYIHKFDLGMPVKEIKLMQEAGMSNMDIIVAGTKHAAIVCNLESEIGTLEEGKIADLLILNDNPLDNINYITNVFMVIHNGSIIREPD
jgi:imidazolonepropionase-like amidohydrolase